MANINNGSKLRMLLCFLVFGVVSSGFVLSFVGAQASLGSVLQTAGNIANSASGTSGNVAGIQTALCNIINSISQILSILALFLFILGGTLYAFAHFLPAAGNLRGSMQGWGMGMLMGGIIALILYMLAPYVIGQFVSLSGGGSSSLNIITGGSSTSGVSSLAPASCSGGLFSGIFGS